MTLKEVLTAYQERVNEKLKQAIDGLPVVAPKLKEAMSYGTLLGGKRVRPFLVYATANALNADLKLADAPAVAIECIHAYSLIHDDLPAMDDDDLRRGHPTVHKKYGEATGVLSGDALQAFAFEVLAKAEFEKDMLSNQVEMLKVLAVGSGYQGMCGGQELDIEAENRLVSKSELEKVHQYKTGALIESAVELGLLCVKDLDENIKKGFRIYAHCIGLAFQVWDDVLDIISDTETLGKPQGSDIDSNKSTYPKLMGLEKAKEYAKSLASTAVASVAALPFDTRILQDFAMYIVERDH